MNIGFPWIPFAASTNHPGLGSVAVCSPHHIVSEIPYRVSRIGHKEQVIPPTLVAVLVYENLFLAVRLDAELKLSCFSTLPNSVLVEEPT